MPNETGSVFSEMWTQRLEADELWNKGLEPGVKHGEVIDSLLSNLMGASRVSVEQWGEIFTREGNFKFKEDCDFSYEEVGYAADGRVLMEETDCTKEDVLDKRISLNRFYEILKDRYKTIFSMINASADQGYEAGFNNHGGEEHIIPVTDTAWDLVKKAGGTIEEQKLVIAAGLSHDLGMLLTRKVHPFASSRIAFALAPELAQNSSIAFQVRKAIILHDEGIARKCVDILASKHGLDTNEFYIAFREKYGVAALALLAADKADVVDRRRATRKPGVDVDVLVEDAQTLTAALADQRGYETITVPGGKETKEIQTRTLSFDPYISEKQEKDSEQIYATNAIKHHNEIFVPLEYRILNREHGIPHYFSWMADIWKYHAKRFGIEARSLFALFPHLDTYHLVVEDDSAWDKVGYKSSFTYEVDHSEVAEYVDFLSNNLAFPERKPRMQETIPNIYKEEARKIRNMDVDGFICALRESDSDSACLKRTLWQSKNGKSAVIARYFFNTKRDPDYIQAHMLKLFEPHKFRL